MKSTAVRIMSSFVEVRWDEGLGVGHSCLQRNSWADRAQYLASLSLVIRPGNGCSHTYQNSRFASTEATCSTLYRWILFSPPTTQLNHDVLSHVGSFLLFPHRPRQPKGRTVPDNRRASLYSNIMAIVDLQVVNVDCLRVTEEVQLAAS